MKKHVGKLWRLILTVMLVASNVGLFNTSVEAAAEWWGDGANASRGDAALGIRYPKEDIGGNYGLSFGSYSTGGKTLGNATQKSESHFTFCIEMGAAVHMDNGVSVEKVTDHLSSFMIDHFITRGTPIGNAWNQLSSGQQNDYRLTHAAMGMYLRDKYEINDTRARYEGAKNKLSSRSDWQDIETRMNQMVAFAKAYSGPYRGTVSLVQDSKKQSAQVEFQILSQQNNDIRNMDAYDVKLTVANGTFNNGQNTLSFKSNDAPSSITVTPNQTGKVTVDMAVSGLPGAQLTKHLFNSGQDFISALEADRLSINANTEADLIKPFKISGSTETPLLLKKGQTLQDRIDVALADGTTWSNILGQSTKVPAKLKLDWYYSEKDYGQTQIPVEQLSNYPDIMKLNTASEEIIADQGAASYVHQSNLVAENYGFYYPVLRFVRSDQGAYVNYFTDDADFQKPFNDTKEQTLVKWQPKVRTTNLMLHSNDGSYLAGHRLPVEGGKIRDRLEVWDNKPDHEITVKSKLYGPFLTKPDFIENLNQHDGGTAVSIPGNLKPYAEVETKITGNGTVDTPEVTIKEEDKGWYVWVETIDETKYTESWQSHFGSENEYVLVPWKANVETKVSTTSAVVGQKIHDRITVIDLPGMWGLLGDGKGNLNDWSEHAELKGKDRDPLTDGTYNMPNGWGSSQEDQALTAKFTMYYSPIKPTQGKVPANAIVFDELEAPLIYGQLNSAEFKAFDKAGYYTIVVSGGDDQGRVAKFQTDYGVPSETVHVTTNDEYYTKVNETKVHKGDPVWDTLTVTKAPLNADAQAKFTLYKYSDELENLDFSNPEEIATSSSGIPITKAGEFSSNLKGYGLEDLTLDAPGTYGWVVKVIDKADNDKVLYEGAHGEYGEVFSVTDVEIKTQAIDSDTEMDEGLANERVTIVDTVSYSGLIPGKEYKISGELMDKATGKAFVTSEGDKVTASKTFTPKNSAGSETLEFVIKKGDLAGKTVVVFEHLEYKNREIAVHADIDDENQTVSYPKVGTKASQVSGLEEDYVAIKDQVAYENLKLEKAYTVKGVLMNKATGEPFIVKNDKGEDVTVTAEATIPADHSGSGMIEVEFKFPRSALTEDLELVVFEELFNVEGKLVGEHKDIDDEDQTVRQVEIGTKASDKETGTNQGLASEDVTIVDEVSYQNLVVGKTYTVKGVLMDQDTGKAFLTKEKKEVHAEKEFVAKTSSGTITLEFIIKQGDLAGKSIVVFEDLYTEDKKIAVHADIEDEEQTVHYPKVGTQAVELSKQADESVVISDIIYYENLIPGASYTARGKLMLKEANAPFTVFGKEVEGQATFVASETGTGHVAMHFSFNRKLLSKDSTLVVFEKIFDAKGNLIGKHEDINDEAQTLTIKKHSDKEPETPTPSTNESGGGGSLPNIKGGLSDTLGYGGSSSGGSGGTLPSTGEKVVGALPYLGILAVTAALVVYYYRKRKQND